MSVLITKLFSHQKFIPKKPQNITREISIIFIRLLLLSSKWLKYIFFKALLLHIIWSSVLEFGFLCYITQKRKYSFCWYQIGMAFYYFTSQFKKTHSSENVIVLKIRIIAKISTNVLPSFPMPSVTK